MTTRKGKLRNNATFGGMIENGGDAYEAAEECYGMIWWLARERARTVVENPSRSYIWDIIWQAEAHYQEGLRLGGVQRDRQAPE